MRPFLALLVAGLVATAFIPRAEAAERFLGVIINQDAGSVHNLFPLDGGAFGIPQGALITIQSNFDSYVCVSDITTNGTINACSSTRGVQVPSGTAFPSACAPLQRIKVEDGGWITDSCIVNVKSVSATGGGNTVIWERNGKEF